ncbi:asparagine synthase-related protein [Actinoalloteichus caeruleus]|nr:asparagine synthase-related protein [Actinoalloteichus caeruleus]
MVVFGDVTGFRRVYTCHINKATVVSNHADVLRRLIDAPVSRTWLAARLTSPDMPSPIRESMTPFNGVHALAPGHRLSLGRNVARTGRYWVPPATTNPCAQGAPILAEELRTAVAGRMRASASPTSVQLSGGMDSTTLSCLAGEALSDRSRLLLVTSASSSPANDDLMWALRVGKHLAPAKHVVLDAQRTPLFFDDLPTAIGGMDEPPPFAAASARVRHLAELLADRGVRLHLNGQGGDEVLLPPLAYLRHTLRRRPRLGWRHLRGHAALRDFSLTQLLRAVVSLPSYPRWLWRAARSLRTEAGAEYDAVGWEAQPLLPQWASGDAERLVRSAILDIAPAPLAEHSTHATLVRIRSTAYRSSLYRDALMAHGVPAEFPYFDRSVVEAALSVVPWDRVDPWQPKPLLRTAVADTVPAPLLARRTKAHYNDDIYRGWSTNQHRAIELFDQSLLAELGLVNEDVLRGCLRSFRPSGLAPGFLSDTIACEVWLRSLAPPFARQEVNHEHI